MTEQEQRVLDLVLSEVQGLRRDVIKQGVAIGRMDERLTRAMADIEEGKAERSTFREKFYQWGIWAAGLAYALYDSRGRM